MWRSVLLALCEVQDAKASGMNTRLCLPSSVATLMLGPPGLVLYALTKALSLGRLF